MNHRGGSRWRGGNEPQGLYSSGPSDTVGPIPPIAEEEVEMIVTEDDLAPARGILIGLLAALVFWAAFVGVLKWWR